MFEKIYKNSIIEKPKFTLLILIILLLSFGYFSKDFQLRCFFRYITIRK